MQSRLRQGRVKFALINQELAMMRYLQEIMTALLRRTLSGPRLRFDGVIAALRPDLCPELVENPRNGH